jgi:hypothetical protein
VALVTAYFIYSAVNEERYLTERFPDAYPEYQRHSKMLIPYVLLFNEGGGVGLSREYGYFLSRMHHDVDLRSLAARTGPLSARSRIVGQVSGLAGERDRGNFHFRGNSACYMHAKFPRSCPWLRLSPDIAGETGRVPRDGRRVLGTLTHGIALPCV